MRYAFFLGCMMPVKYPGHESATRIVAEMLGIELVVFLTLGVFRDFGREIDLLTIDLVDDMREADIGQVAVAPVPGLEVDNGFGEERPVPGFSMGEVIRFTPTAGIIRFT